MLGFAIDDRKDAQSIELCIEHETTNHTLLIPMNKENMTAVRDSLHNELLDANRIMRARGWDD